MYSSGPPSSVTKRKRATQKSPLGRAKRRKVRQPAAPEVVDITDTSQTWQHTGCDAVVQAPSQQQAPLLGLPAELRDMIWRYALLEEDEIVVQRGMNDLQPGLLRASRQLRRETRPIYCRENRFSVAINKLKLEPQRAHWVWNLSSEEASTIDLHGDPSWQNLKGWLYRVWRDPDSISCGRSVDDGGSALSSFLHTAFEVTRHRSLEGIPWGAVEAMLEALKKVVEIRDPSMFRG